MNDFKLCYVELPWCYFTTQDIGKQWGDDWNDAPYEHNAGTPYTWREHSDDPQYEIMKIAIDADLEAPYEHHFNSPYSVEMINGGSVPWLKSPSYASNKIEIMAGIHLDNFIALVKSINGKVYTEV